MKKISRETIADTLYNLTKQQSMTLELCSETLQKIMTEDLISETNYLKLSNTIRELEALREVFIVRLLNSMKRGDILLD
jgi:hypothetical protein